MTFSIVFLFCQTTKSVYVCVEGGGDQLIPKPKVHEKVVSFVVGKWNPLQILHKESKQKISTKCTTIFPCTLKNFLHKMVFHDQATAKNALEKFISSRTLEFCAFLSFIYNILLALHNFMTNFFF